MDGTLTVQPIAPAVPPVRTRLVVDAIAARQRRGHQRHHLVATVGLAWGPAQVQMPVNQLGQAETQSQGGRKDQPALLTFQDSCYWVLLVSGWFCVSKTIIPRSTGALSYPFSTPRHSSLRWIGAKTTEAST